MAIDAASGLEVEVKVGDVWRYHTGFAIYDWEIVGASPEPGEVWLGTTVSDLYGGEPNSMDNYDEDAVMLGLEAEGCEHQKWELIVSSPDRSEMRRRWR